MSALSKYEIVVNSLPERGSIVNEDGARALLSGLIEGGAPQAVYEASFCLADCYRSLRATLLDIWVGWVEEDYGDPVVWSKLKALLVGS